MNLQPIPHHHSGDVSVACTRCHRMQSQNVMLADLDAPAGTFVCVDCRPAYLAQGLIAPVQA